MSEFALDKKLSSFLFIILVIPRSNQATNNFHKIFNNFLMNISQKKVFRIYMGTCDIFSLCDLIVYSYR